MAAGSDDISNGAEALAAVAIAITTVSTRLSSRRTERNAKEALKKQDELAAQQAAESRRREDAEEAAKVAADQVAVVAAEAARLVIASADRAKASADQVAADLLVSNTVQADAMAAQAVKLDIVHALVNSNLTEQMQGQLDAKQAQLDATKALVVVLREKAGPSETDLIDITEAEARIVVVEDQINELKQAVMDRKKAATGLPTAPQLVPVYREPV